MRKLLIKNAVAYHARITPNYIS